MFAVCLCVCVCVCLWVCVRVRQACLLCLPACLPACVRGVSGLPPLTRTTTGKKVRECLSTLDLDVMVYPCPRETLRSYGICKDSRYRPAVQELGGKQIFPFLVDENTDTKLYDSDAIISYLYETYGKGCTAPANDRLANAVPALKMLGLFLCTAVRCLPRMGLLRTPSHLPAKPLELYGYEGSPFVKLAREALCTLELPYLLHNVAHGSAAKRTAFAAAFGAQFLSGPRKALGAIMVPLLVDPNTGAAMVESADIVRYLFETYAAGETVSESFGDYSTKGASAEHGVALGAKRPAAAAAAAGGKKAD